MTMSIRTNVGSLNAQRNLMGTQNQLSTTLSKLSSGYRITKAGDDAAGLAISETLRSQISGLNQAARNANDAISMIQTAEGGMQEIHSMLQRMNQLAVQAKNGTLDSKARNNINVELQELATEINAIADRTNFNGVSLLSGTSPTVTGASAVNAGADLSTFASIASIDTSRAGASKSFALTADTTANTITLTNTTDGTSQTIAAAAVSAGQTSELNFSELGVSFSLLGRATGSANDIATAIDGLTDGTFATGAGANATVTFQVGAAAGDEMNVTFSSVKIEGSTGVFGELNTALSNFTTDPSGLIDAVAAAVDEISTKRAALGAAQNRLDHTVANLNITAENLSASESRIRDADVAEETAAMSRQNILMQAGVSVLAQANQMPQLALKLLG
jgi:flagellin